MKSVEFNGEKYKVTIREYGYNSSQLVINGETSSSHIENDQILNINVFSIKVKKAIEEYITRKLAHNNFKKWDGKITI